MDNIKFAKKLFSISLFIIFLLSIITFYCCGDNDESKEENDIVLTELTDFGSIQGYIYQNNNVGQNPASFSSASDSTLIIKSAVITVNEAGLSIYSDDSGYYKIDKIPVGTYSIGVLKKGYEYSIKNNVKVSNNEITSDINFYLITDETSPLPAENLSVEYSKGKTTITWTESPDEAGEEYFILRSTAIITKTDYKDTVYTYFPPTYHINMIINYYSGYYFQAGINKYIYSVRPNTNQKTYYAIVTVDYSSNYSEPTQNVSVIENTIDDPDITPPPAPKYLYTEELIANYCSRIYWDYNNDEDIYRYTIVRSKEYIGKIDYNKQEYLSPEWYSSLKFNNTLNLYDESDSGLYYYGIVALDVAGNTSSLVTTSILEKYSSESINDFLDCSFIDFNVIRADSGNIFISAVAKRTFNNYFHLVLLELSSYYSDANKFKLYRGIDTNYNSYTKIADILPINFRFCDSYIYYDIKYYDTSTKVGKTYSYFLTEKEVELESDTKNIFISYYDSSLLVSPTSDYNAIPLIPPVWTNDDKYNFNGIRKKIKLNLKLPDYLPIDIDKLRIYQKDLKSDNYSIIQELNYANIKNDKYYTFFDYDVDYGESKTYKALFVDKAGQEGVFSIIENVYCPYTIQQRLPQNNTAIKLDELIFYWNPVPEAKTYILHVKAGKTTYSLSPYKNIITKKLSPQPSKTQEWTGIFSKNKVKYGTPSEIEFPNLLSDIVFKSDNISLVSGVWYNWQVVATNLTIDDWNELISNHEKLLYYFYSEQNNYVVGLSQSVSEHGWTFQVK